MDLNEILKVKVFREYANIARDLNAINLAQGVPEPLLDEKVNEYLKNNLHYGWSYVEPKGIEKLRLAITHEYNNDFHINDVLITSGGAESLYLSFASAKEFQGNKIAFLAPFFPFYQSLSKIFEMETFYTKLKISGDDLALNLNQIEDLFKAGVKTFVLNTPHNPSGWTLSVTESHSLRLLLDKYGVLLIIDEVYRNYIYNDTIDEKMAIKTLYENNTNLFIVGSASKLLSVTGMRIGWLIAKSQNLELAYALHSHTSYCQPAPLQHTVSDLLNDDKEVWFTPIKNHYKEKKDKLISALRNFGFTCPNVNGGHFILANYTNISD
jgi:N-succinyldiaminopimelate aminotransferase